MWCPHCHDDVAAAVSSDNQRIRCATCGAELGLAQSLPSSSKTREARELLKRWSEETILDSSGPVPHVQSAGSFSSVNDLLRDSTASPELSKVESGIEKLEQKHQAGSSQTSSSDEGGTTLERQTSTPSAPLLRFDTPHQDQDSSELPKTQLPEKSYLNASRDATASIQNPTASQAASAVKTTQIHNAHENVTPAPHFDVHSVVRKLQQHLPRNYNWNSLGGQLLAYCGVGLITIGTALVLWGYFGGPVHYTPTGWLVATAGQMLLFLGVIMLVSGGLEQTTEEVSRTMEQIGERLIRIEQNSREQTLRGPKVHAERFSKEGTAKESADVPVQPTAEHSSP
jgi:hypothetical protein